MPPNNQVQNIGVPAGQAGQFAQPLPPGQVPPPMQQPAQQPGQPPASTAAKKDQPKQASTQNSLLFSELRENMVVMGDGTFRAIVACKSINFDLMSSREREGVEYSYQNFLNALTFPVQILVRSQRVDIGPYLEKLMGLRRSQDNMLLGVLMEDYINFIDVLSQEANIMDKSFFVIVPFFPAGDLSNVMEKSKGFFGGFVPKQNGVTVTKIDKATYDKAKDSLRDRVESVISGLNQVGINAVQLNTKEIGELLYNFYNPDTAVREPLGDFTNTTSMYVRKGQSQTEAQNG